MHRREDRERHEEYEEHVVQLGQRLFENDPVRQGPRAPLLGLLATLLRLLLLLELVVPVEPLKNSSECFGFTRKSGSRLTVGQSTNQSRAAGREGP